MAGSDGSKSYRETVQTPHDYPFHPETKTLTWQRLESLRLEKLGLSNRYSRHFNVLRQSNDRQRTQVPFLLTCVGSPRDAMKKVRVFEHIALYIGAICFGQ